MVHLNRLISTRFKPFLIKDRVWRTMDDLWVVATKCSQFCLEDDWSWRSGKKTVRMRL